MERIEALLLSSIISHKRSCQFLSVSHNKLHKKLASLEATLVQNSAHRLTE